MKFLFFLFFLLIPIVYGIDGNIIGGQSFTIGTVEKCVGDIDITIRADKDIDDNEYNFTNCTISYGNDRRENWECSCNQTPFDVIMNTNKNAVNGYDFEIEYSKTEVIVINNPSTSSGGGSSSGGGGYYYKPKNTTNTTTSSTQKATLKDTKTGKQVTADINTQRDTQANTQGNTQPDTLNTQAKPLENTQDITGGRFNPIWIIVILIVLGVIGQGVYYLFFSESARI